MTNFLIIHCVKTARIRVSVILSLYGEVRVSENPYSRIFYAVLWEEAKQLRLFHLVFRNSVPRVHFHSLIAMQKHPLTDVLHKSFSEKLQTIYRKIPTVEIFFQYPIKLQTWV